MVLWPATRGQPDCLRAQQAAALTHDNLFHTTLGVLGITATEYNPKLDALAPCRAS